MVPDYNKCFDEILEWRNIKQQIERRDDEDIHNTIEPAGISSLVIKWEHT